MSEYLRSAGSGAKKGKKIVLGSIIVLIVDSIYSVINNSIYANVSFGTALLSSALQIAAVGIIGYFLYTGKNWAKQIYAILFLVSAAAFILRIITALTLWRDMVSAWLLIQPILAGLYLALGLALLLSPSVKDFLHHQRDFFTSK